LLKGTLGRYSSDELRDAFTFLLPLILFISIFILLPVMGTFLISTYREVTFLEKEFVFLENYLKLLSDGAFWQSLRFTLLFVLVSVPLEMVLGLAFALIINERIPFRGLLRTVLLIPWAVPLAVSARVWELIYNYNYGLANLLLLKMGITDEPVNWLGTELGAFIALVISDVWKTTPFVAIIFLAGLQAIPGEIYAQAQIDGANLFQRFFRITLPLLKPVAVVALLFRSVDALRVFDLVYVLTHGGPGGSTTSLSLYAYKHFLAGDFGYGSAVSVILFLIAFLLSILYVRASGFLSEVAR